MPPEGSWAASQAFNLPFISKIPQKPAHHISTYSGAGPFQVIQGKLIGRLHDSRLNEGSLGTPGAFYLPNSFFKFFIGGFKNIEKVIDIGPGIMSAFMPALRTLLQSLVVTLLVLFNEAFQAYVTADFISKVVAIRVNALGGRFEMEWL